MDARMRDIFSNKTTAIVFFIFSPLIFLAFTNHAYAVNIPATNLAAPIDYSCSNNNSLTNVKATWTPGSPLKYAESIQVGTTTDFSNCGTGSSTCVVHTSKTMYNLKTSTIYYWRVESDYTNGEIGYSQYSSFMINANTCPTGGSQCNPVDNSSNGDNPTCIAGIGQGTIPLGNTYCNPQGQCVVPTGGGGGTGTTTVTLSGKVMDSAGKGIQGVIINNGAPIYTPENKECHIGKAPPTGADGTFSFSVPSSQPFCMRAPAISGYNGPDKSYECQIAGKLQDDPNCGTAGARLDVGPDTTYNFIYTSISSPAPPPVTASITGPTTIAVGQTVTFNATANDSSGKLSQGEIYFSPTSTEQWQRISLDTLSGTTASFTGSQQFGTAGTFYVVANAYSNSGSKCTGNPFQIPTGSTDCGAASRITVTVGFKPTDIDRDGDIDLIDFGYWLKAFQEGGNPPFLKASGDPYFPDVHVAPSQPANTIDLLDFGAWLNAYQAQ